MISGNMVLQRLYLRYSVTANLNNSQIFFVTSMSFNLRFVLVQLKQSPNLHKVQIGNVRCTRATWLDWRSIFVKTRTVLIKLWQPGLRFSKVKYNLFGARNMNNALKKDSFLTVYPQKIRIFICFS